MKLLFYFITLVVFVKSICAQAQNPNLIQILSNERIYENRKDSFRTIAGNVIIKQGNTLFKADSVYINDKLAYNFMEAFGKVYINENDSVVTTAGYLKYYLATKKALLKNEVTITNKTGNITAPELTYDLNSKLATYTNSATIKSKTSTLTSKAGQYYSNTKDALFTNNVKLKGTEYDVATDSLYYNVGTEIANFVTYTKVTNIAKGQVIETTRGFYNMRTGNAQFSERSKLEDKTRKVIADNISINEKAKKYNLRGKAIFIDYEEKAEYRGEIVDFDKLNELYHIEGNGMVRNEKENFVITGNYLDGDGKSGKFLARGKPVLIIKQDGDSTYITADTLYSNKVNTTKKIVTDSITKQTTITFLKNLTELNKPKPKQFLVNNTTDTTLRYFEAFHHVKIYNDSLQALCDSLYYSDVDSTIRLYKNPIVWNQNNQITGDTIYLHTRNKKAQLVEVIERAFVINKVEPKFFNQIKGNNLTCYLNDGNLDSLYARGSAEIIFYIQDEAKGFVGVDKSAASIINAYFTNREIYKLKWINKYDATTNPMQTTNHNTMRLRNFNHQFNLRPKSKFELFF